MVHYDHGQSPDRRHGAAAVFSLVLLVVLIGFASLTLDVGAMYNTRADLQNAADAAAMAAASAYITPEMTAIRLGKSTDISEVLQFGIARAQATGLSNRSFAAGGTTISSDDIEFGWIDVESATSDLDAGVAPNKHNAVRVTTRRTKESANGPLYLFFAPIFGKHTANVTATAVAVFDDRFGRFDVAIPQSAPLWPFTIEENEYKMWTLSAADEFTYDEDQGVQSGKDGVSEVQLYPDKLASGNYGLLNIGSPSQGTTDLSNQILNGVSPSDLQTETGSSELTFYDDSGDPQSYEMTGNPGLKASLNDSVSKRIGDIVGFFLHDSVSGSGSGTTYRITGIRFARVMDVNLKGSSSQRGLWVQPVTYLGPGVIIISGAPTSDGVAGRIVLAR